MGRSNTELRRRSSWERKDGQPGRVLTSTRSTCARRRELPSFDHFLAPGPVALLTHGPQRAVGAVGAVGIGNVHGPNGSARRPVLTAGFTASTLSSGANCVGNRTLLTSHLRPRGRVTSSRGCAPDLLVSPRHRTGHCWLPAVRRMSSTP